MFCTNRWIVLAMVVAALLPWQTTSAQPQSLLTVTQVDTTAYPQVRVLLAASSGTLPDPASMRVTEDGNEIATDQVEANLQRTGVAVAVLIDTSRSMRGQGMPESSDRLQDARDRTIELAKALNFDTDLITIFAFHRDVVPVLPLSRVDGGAVANTVVTAPVLGPIPDKPGGANRPPSAEDLRNDDRAFSAFSQAVSRAIDELNNPQTSDAYIRQNLPAMQKVIVIFADSCDDTLDAPGSKTCSIPVDVQTKLQDVVRAGNIAFFSIGLGTTDANRAAPKAPQRAEAGFLYTARFELLQLYAQQVPNSRYFQFYTAEADQAETVRSQFTTEVVEPIVGRGDQLVITYPSRVNSVGQQRRLTISNTDVQVQASFEEPRVPPAVTILSEQRDGQLQIRPEILYSQAPLARVDYYVDGSTLPITGEPPTFALDLTQVQPGARRIALEAVDQRGDRSPRSQELTIDIPVPPTPTPVPIVPLPPDVAPTAGNQLNQFLLNNIVSLITLLLVVLLAIFVLANPRGRAAASQMTNRVTGVIQRMTRPIAGGAAAPTTADYVLVVRQGDTVGTEYPLPNLNTYLGADPSLVDIVLSDPHVSGRHASINREVDDLFVTDLGSTNGTMINRVQIPPNVRTQLRANDILTVGGVSLECVWRGVAQGQVAAGVAQQHTVAYQPGKNGSD